MSRRPKQVEATWLMKEPVTKKSMTEMGFRETNEAGIRPQLNERGRPSLYDSKTMPYQAYVMCAQHGATFEELGKLWAVSSATVSDWVQKYAEFAKAIRSGRDAFTVGQIELSLVKRALGFEYEEVSTREIQYKVKIGPKESKLIPANEITRTKKLIVPDIAAIIFYLKNRASDRWKDKMPEWSVSGEVGDLKATLSGCTTDDLRAMRDAMKSALPEPKKETTQ